MSFQIFATKPFRDTSLLPYHEVCFCNKTGLLTLAPSTEESYEVMLNALIQAIQHIRQ